MARLTQSQLSGFRIGTDPTSQPEPPSDVPRRDAATPDTARATQKRIDLHSRAPVPPTDRPSLPTPLGPLPAAPTRTEPRHKVGLTLPVELAEQVRAFTKQGFALADLVMVAYQDQRDRLLDEHQAATPRRLVRHPHGRSPITISLTHAERTALDALAEHLGWTRSQTVAALLDCQFRLGPSPQ